MLMVLIASLAIQIFNRNKEEKLGIGIQTTANGFTVTLASRFNGSDDRTYGRKLHYVSGTR
jgi:hypothetical protein